MAFIGVNPTINNPARSIRRIKNKVQKGGKRGGSRCWCMYKTFLSMIKSGEVAAKERNKGV